MEISVTYKKGKFHARNVKPNEPLQSVMKDSGWKFNLRDGWFTTNIKSASLLRDHADDRAENIFKRSFNHISPWKGALTIPKGLKLLDHQPGSVRFALNRKRSYLALAPGLGKTIVAAIIAATLKKRTLVVVPPFLVLNTVEEFKKWAPSLVTLPLSNTDWILPDVLVLPDSMVTNPDVRKYIRVFAPQVFIGDEWHRYKNDKAARSKAVYGFTDGRKNPPYQPGVLDGRHLEKVIVMSGTPMPNRPIELFPVLKKLAGEYIDFMSYNQYGLKICAGFKIVSEWTNKVFGYDFTGCDEVEFKKLMKRVRTKKTDNMTAFMLRLDKKILNLPPLTEEITILGEDMPKRLRSMDGELLKLYSPKDLIKLEMKKMMGKADDSEDIHLMTYRRLLGEYKVKPATAYFKGVLEDTDDVLLIVAIHKDTIHKLAENLSDYSPVVVTGDTPMKKRHSIVRAFQASEDRVFLANIDAIGVGFTLTRCTRIFLLEYLYSPGGNRQVIDRVHRFTLDHPVLAEYLVFRNSLDASTIKTLLYKEKITSYV